jgi:capsid protein
MSSTPRHVVNEFAAIRADYEMSRASRFVRHRTGTAPLGGGEDWNYREETRYYRDIEQARDMDRNDGLVGTLADRRVDNIVQQGFTLDTKTGDKKLDQDLWHRWQAFANDPEMCDIAGEMTFHEMERHVCRSESIDGDIIGVGTEDGPLQLHEAHAVQTSTKIESTFLGVTRDQYGKRTQYHVRYDLNQFATKSESIPIDVRNSEGVRQLFHVYNPKRISATRGVTQLAPVFSLSGMLEDINFAKLVQQQAVSCFAILSEKAVGSNGNLPNVDRQSKFGEPSTEQTGSGVRNLEGVSPGMFYDGREGETLKGFSPNIPNSEYFQQVKLILQIVGVNFGLPLCLILMDGSETNFSGWRGAVDEARKGFVADQLNLVRRWHSPVYRWWLHREMAMEPILQRAAERQGIDIFGHAWQLPTWSYIEPVADAEGDTAQLRNALTSPRRMHAARGKDWETIAEEIIDDNVYAIAKAQAKADSHNQKFPKAPPLSWRDLIPLPMPEGQTLAMQDPNAIAAQEEAANAEDAEQPPQPEAKAKRTPRAAKDGKWRTTDDGGKIFISEDGDVNFGGPGGEPAKQAAPAKSPSHNVKLTKGKNRLGIDAANLALKQMGMSIKRNTVKNDKTGEISTTYELEKSDGSREKKTMDEIRDFIYESAEDYVPKPKKKDVKTTTKTKEPDKKTEPTKQEEPSKQSRSNQSSSPQLKGGSSKGQAFSFGSASIDSKHSTTDKAWVKSLPKNEAKALAAYTSSVATSGDIRKDSAKKNKSEQTKALLSALDKAEKHEGVVYRGVSTLGDPKFAEKLLSMKTGDTYTEKGLASTSVNPDVAVGFTGGGSDKESGILFRIKTKTGARVKEPSIHKFEEEVITKPGVKYKVVGNHANAIVNGKRVKSVIELEEA